MSFACSPRAFFGASRMGPEPMRTVVLLTGALRIKVGAEAYDLAPGDTLFFEANVAHSYENLNSRESRCLDIIGYGHSADAGLGRGRRRSMVTRAVTLWARRLRGENRIVDVAPVAAAVEGRRGRACSTAR